MYMCIHVYVMLLVTAIAIHVYRRLLVKCESLNITSFAIFQKLERNVMLCNIYGIWKTQTHPIIKGTFSLKIVQA